MQCKDAYKYICDNLDQKVDSPECRAIRKHLEQCPDCSAYLQSLRETVLLYRAVQTPHVSLAVHRRLMAALHAALKEQGRGRNYRGQKKRGR